MGMAVRQHPRSRYARQSGQERKVRIHFDQNQFLESPAVVEEATSFSPFREKNLATIENTAHRN